MASYIFEDIYFTSGHEDVYYIYIYICIFINIYYMYIYIYLLPFPKVQGVATSQLRWGETALELRCFQIFQSFYWN